jgi:hypothetical protein
MAGLLCEVQERGTVVHSWASVRLVDLGDIAHYCTSHSISQTRSEKAEPILLIHQIYVCFDHS